MRGLGYVAAALGALFGLMTIEAGLTHNAGVLGGFAVVGIFFAAGAIVCFGTDRPKLKVTHDDGDDLWSIPSWPSVPSGWMLQAQHQLSMQNAANSAAQLAGFQQAQSSIPLGVGGRGGPRALGQVSGFGLGHGGTVGGGGSSMSGNSCLTSRMAAREACIVIAGMFDKLETDVADTPDDDTIQLHVDFDPKCTIDELGERAAILGNAIRDKVGVPRFHMGMGDVSYEQYAGVAVGAVLAYDIARDRMLGRLDVLVGPSQKRSAEARGLTRIANKLADLPAFPATMGFRSWCFNPASGTLASPHQGTLWHDAELRCETWDEASVVRGVAGIHALLAPWDWKSRTTGYETNGANGFVSVSGLVERFGRFVLGTEGWRAEWVVIRALHAPNRGIAAALREIYPDVEVTHADR